MHRRKRTALLLAAVGALTIGGAGSAGAADNDSGTKSAPGGTGSQKNHCDTNSAIGPIRIVGLAPTGDITTETNCLNYSESGVLEQSNRCRHTSTIGSITINPGLAPAGDITSRTNCINYSKTGGVVRQSNKCDTRSTIGDITISPLAPGPKITQETNCVNVSGAGDGNGNGKSGNRSGR
ncbi:hypothetical protein AB0E27_24685 [Streptomyces sparsogenes]|uniref:hypothetical protein n=1 Tax=Streptomyces sparsogenes TaxID=67365 RepID=UPI0033D1F072